MYLVTPDDFQPKDATDEPTPPGSTDNHNKENDSIKTTNDENDDAKSDEKDANGMDMDDDENPFLKSIKKSIKKDDEPKNISNKFEKDCNIAKDEVIVEDSVEAKMLEFFLEFAEAKEYKELRFLGKFTTEQMEVVNRLLNDIAACIDDKDNYEGNKEVLKVFDVVRFELKEGLNGTTE